MIGKGTFGSVYNCRDRQNPNLKLVMKVSSHKVIAQNEVRTIENICETAKKDFPSLTNNFPQIKCKGYFTTGSKSADNISESNQYMFIMNKFGKTVEKMQYKQSFGFNRSIQIAI